MPKYLFYEGLFRRLRLQERLNNTDRWDEMENISSVPPEPSDLLDYTFKYMFTLINTSLQNDQFIIF